MYSVHLCHLTQFAMAYNQKPAISLLGSDALSLMEEASLLQAEATNGTSVQLPSASLDSNEIVIAADSLLLASTSLTSVGVADSLVGSSLENLGSSSILPGH